MGQYFNFVLVSKKDGDATRITTELERNKLYHVESAVSGHDCMERLKRGGIHALVFNFDQLTLERTRLITTIREVGFGYPVIIFAGAMSTNGLEATQKLSRVVAIEKPFESKDVWGICQKLLQGQKVPQRIFRRYYTDQSVAIEKSTTGETLDGRVLNLSKGGAYMELGKGKIAPGEMVKMTISLDRLSRAYNVDAEVVWCNAHTNLAGRRAAGVRFIKSDDVYRNLLNRL